jgi:hypothetical protein
MTKTMKWVSITMLLLAIFQLPVASPPDVGYPLWSVLPVF